MSTEKDEKDAKAAPPEKQHIFDNPRNVRWLLRVFFVICAGLFGADYIIHRHVEHPMESLFGFYGLYGFIACVLLVLIAKEMRKVLMRAENYYEDKAGKDK